MSHIEPQRKIRVLIVDDPPQEPEASLPVIEKKRLSFLSKIVRALFKPPSPGPSLPRRIYRPSLAERLADQDDIEVIATVHSAPECLELARQQEPDIVIWGLSDGLTPAQGISWIKTLERETSTQVITAAHASETTRIREYMLAGGREFLIKPPTIEQLATSIRRVAQSSKR